MLKQSFGFVLGVVCALGADAAVLHRPSVSPAFFNPTIGQAMSLAFTLKQPASVTVRVIDRDGVPVRTLTRQKALPAGSHSLPWNGRNDLGAVVPNEAWSFRIDVTAKNGNETYFPAKSAAPMYRVNNVTYDRRGARCATRCQSHRACISRRGSPPSTRKRKRRTDQCSRRSSTASRELPALFSINGMGSTRAVRSWSLICRISSSASPLRRFRRTP